MSIEQNKELTAINTPAQASTYFLPFLVTKRLTLPEIKEILRDEYHFSEEDIKATSVGLSQAYFEFYKELPSRYRMWLTLVCGVLILILGILTTFYFIQHNAETWPALLLGAVGIGLIYLGVKWLRTGGHNFG